MNLSETQEKGLLDRLFRTPSGRKMRAEMEMEEAEQSARKAAIDELPKLRDERAELIGQHDHERQASVERVKKAQDNLTEAIQAASKCDSRQHAELFVLDTKIAKCELFLRETAPNHLNEKIIELEAEIAAIRAEDTRETLVGANRTDAHIETNYQDRSKRLKIAQQEIHRLKSRMLTEV